MKNIEKLFYNEREYLYCKYNKKYIRALYYYIKFKYYNWKEERKS